MQQKYTTQESIAPYYKTTVSDGSTAVPECRAVVNRGDSALVDLTMNGVVVRLWLEKGTVYPFACTLATDTDVVYLY